MRKFFDDYTRDLTAADVQRLFTRDAGEAYRFFARGIDADHLASLPWYRRWFVHGRQFFVAFTMRLSPARRMLYAVSLIFAVVGAVKLFRGVQAPNAVGVLVTVPTPHWVDGTFWMILGFVGVNLLVLLEVADRLSLKGDLEIARDIQLAMLPRGMQEAGATRAFGMTRPANTVGGDLYDLIRLRDGRIAVVVGDVAGKGSPAALLMALILSILRTLVDEGFEPVRLIQRLNLEVARRSPVSRFITLFYAVYDPMTGALAYINAGHPPAIVRRRSGAFERLPGHGLALGMFEGASYELAHATVEPGDLLVLYSDGVTDAENAAGRPFDDDGLEAAIGRAAIIDSDPETIGRAVLSAVDTHAGDVRLADDLTVLVLARRA